MQEETVEQLRLLINQATRTNNEMREFNLAIDAEIADMENMRQTGNADYGIEMQNNTSEIQNQLRYFTGETAVRMLFRIRNAWTEEEIGECLPWYALSSIRTWCYTIGAYKYRDERYRVPWNEAA